MNRNTLFSLLCFVLVLFMSESVFGKSVVPKKIQQQVKNSSKSELITGPIVYEQTEPQGMFGFTSHRFTEVDFKAYTAEACDDFVVPAGETFEFSTIVANGTSYGVPVKAVNVIFYNDDNGKPGTEVEKILNHTDINFIGDGTIEVVLTENISLSEGNYWFSIQAINESLSADYAQGWMWITLDETAVESIGNPLMWRNPLDGIGSGFTDWVYSTDFTNNWGEAYPAMDLSFGFYKSRLPKDLGITEIITPENGVLDNAQELTVTIFNYGTEDQTGFDIKYQIDNGEWVTENVGDLVLAAGSQANYTFVSTLDLSEVKTYSVTCVTALNGEENLQNDAITKEVVNYGTLYKFTEFETIEVCEGTFTDAGGLDNWNAPMSDTATIYPLREGQRTQLTFREFDNGWSAFHIYDGKNADAPEIDLTPDNDNTLYAFGNEIKRVVTAKNTSGALTIVFDGKYGSESGWIASINCFTPPDDDFAVQSAVVEKTTLFANQQTEIYATIYNNGLKKLAKEVSLSINGTVLETIKSDSIGANETTKVTFEWMPTTAGIYEIELSIPDDEGENADNNVINLTQEVFAEGTLAESFEGKLFPPEFWSVSLGIWDRMPAEYIPVHGDFFAHSMEHDTLVTPKLIIGDNDSISFMAMSQQWWFSTLDLYYSANPAGPWEFLSTVPLTIGAVTPEYFTIDLSPAKGNNHIAFAVGGGSPGWAKDMMIDMVKGPKIYYHNKNLSIRSLEGNVAPNQYDTLVYSSTVKNNGVNALLEGDYLVKFYVTDENGVETLLETKRGLPIDHVQTLEYNFEYIPQDFGPFSLQTKVELAEDADVADNTSEVLNVYVLPFGTDEVIFGEATMAGSALPWHTYTDYTVSQMLYKADEIGEPGTIKGISYFYENTSSAPASIPVEIYMYETDDANLENGFLEASNFVMMFNDTIDFSKNVTETREVFIPFKNPFIYSGKNLVVMIYKKPADNDYAVNFVQGPTDIELRSYYSSFYGGNGVDLSDLAEFNNLVGNEFYHNSNMPNTTFFVNHSGMGEIAGVVYDENNKPKEGVELVLEGTQPVFSAEDGRYKFSVVPEGQQLVTAMAFGYNNQVSNTTVIAGAQTALDFYMVPKPTVTLSGRVVRSDNLLGVEGLTIPLVGYDNYEVVTNANGEFIISDIYANEPYVLTVELENFTTYVNDTLLLKEGENIDLGDIVLQEIIEPVYGVVANEVETGMEISWQRPMTGKLDTIDMGAYFFSTGYAADAHEEVWMGNKFEVQENTTVTGLNFTLWNYTTLGATNGKMVTVELFNANQELIASVPVEMTQEIEEGSDNGTFEVHLADIPDVTVNGTFYAMVHWPGLDVITPLLAHDEGNDYETVPDNAYYKYAGQGFSPLSSLIGKKGVFEITANTITKVNKAGNLTKEITGYDVYRGLVSDMDNVPTWEALNAETIVNAENEISFVDETWAPAESGYYIYAVSSDFTAGTSGYSFSDAIALGMHANVTLNISTNTEELAVGALVFLTNTNGNNVYSYETKVTASNGTVELNKIMRGEYNLKVVLANYEVLEKVILIEEDNNAYDAELIQIIMTPDNLMAEAIDNKVNLTWTLGNEKTYILDNETAETGLRISANSEAWIGNKFETSDLGYVTSVEVFGSNPEGGEVGSEKLTVDIFNGYGELVGSSKPFIMEADVWTTVEVPNVPINGDFYALVHWDYLTSETNFLTVDTDGPNTESAYYYDRETGLVMLKEWNMPGAFLVRTTANIEGESEVLYPSVTNTEVEMPAFIESAKVMTSVNVKKQETIPEVTYNIYLNDMVNPIATGITELSYLLEAGMMTEGEGYYKTAVSAVYASGESNTDTITFYYKPTSIVDLASKLSIYPNPAQNHINVNGLAGASIDLYSLTGDKLSTYHNIDQNFRIGLDDLNTGIYLIKITLNGEAIVRKVEVVK